MSSRIFICADMKKQPQQPEQQRSDYSAPALSGAHTEIDDAWFRVEVTDARGQVVAIETEMLAGRAIGDEEERAIKKAIGHLAGFLGTPGARSWEVPETAQKPNTPNDAVAVREALAELVRQDRLQRNALGYGCGCDDECKKHDWSRSAYEAAWERARALLEPK